MYIYNFYGIVHPERAEFRFTSFPEFNLSLPEVGVEGVMTLKSLGSEIVIGFRTELNLLEHPEKDILVTLKNMLGEQTMSFIDAYCYIRSFNFDLEIYRVYCPELSMDTTFDTQLETDLELDKSEEQIIEQVNIKLSELTSLMFHQNTMFLGDVFADFKKAIKYPKSSGFYFYRAVDTIRQNAFEGNWNKLNNALGFTPEHYSDLNIYRKENAHGVYSQITGDMRVKLAKDARKVIEAFIDFCLRDVVWEDR